MVEWILILTLIGNTNQSGQAIEHVPGFSSRESCADAGNEWLAQMRESYARIARAVCIRRPNAAQRVEM